MNLLDFVSYLAAFVFLWIGSGIIISAVDGFSKHLKLSPFSVSFFFLGILTSIPEFAVGFTSIAEETPEIFTGNLLGGVTVIFLFVVPILAILGNGIKLTRHVDNKVLGTTLLVIATPALLILDRRISNSEAIIFILLYVILFFLIERKKGILDGFAHNGMNLQSYSPMNILKILLGVGIVLVSSHFAVNRTIAFAGELGISPLILSLIVLSIGTNLPELSLAIRAVVTKRGEIALGDYLGSAAANTLLFGILSLVNKGEVFTSNGFLTNFYFTVVGLGAFYYFAQSERKISRKEGIILLLMYLTFAGLELTA